MIAVLVGFLGAELALRLSLPKPPPVNTEAAVVALPPERAQQCEEIEGRFGQIDNPVDRGTLERLHTRLGCDPVGLSSRWPSSGGPSQ